MKRGIGSFLTAFLVFGSSAVPAHESAAFDSLLAQKRKADISFAQLMQIMHQATGMIFDGILYENPEMVALGAHLLAEHPAPAKGPAAAIVPERREEFKNVMPTYDKVFQGTAERVTADASKGRWPDAYAGYREITHACVACHMAWRHHAISRQTSSSARGAVP